MIEIKNKRDCCGCNACVEICPQSCIAMTEDKHGFRYPVVDHLRCVDCGLCERVCPMISQPDFHSPQCAFGAISLNNETYGKSSSGAAAFELCAETLKQGGTVYGCASEGTEARHVRVDSIADLSKLQRSKYVQSTVDKVFKNVKEDLSKGLKVVFTGTPCQCAALGKFLNRGRKSQNGAEAWPNLLVVEIICHGVPSQKMLANHVKAIVKGQHVDKVVFGRGYSISLVSNCRTIYDAPYIDEASADLYMKGFLHTIINRPSCYVCPFARPERTADITVGDFWGMKREEELTSTPAKGVSLIMPSTEKGLQAVELLKSKMKMVERPVQEAINGNHQLRHPAVEPAVAKIFRIAYPTLSFDKAMKLATIKSEIVSLGRKILTRKHD